MPKKNMTDDGRYNLLGVKCDAIDVPELLGIFEHAINTNQPNFIVGNHNIHSIYLFQRHPQMRRFYDLKGVTYIDSMPLIFLGKMLGLPLERKHRTAFLDWHEDLLSLAEAKDWRIFYVGGRQESLNKVSQLFRKRYPKLSIRFHHGYFDESELPALYDGIRGYCPNILLVGMGMPRQEKWILDAYQHVHANVIVNGGAMIEYLIGEQAPAPRWLGQLGLEWLFRLALQPRRLAGRYLVEPFYLLRPLARDFVAAWTGTEPQSQRFRDPRG
ncbi:MAG TPA: WecB/TagA/CpsF family glycosyltransferase [Bryobacteraceae bacterium]|jgi:N-acetylglucosaminyldiphosphoundecaprenol N-acetyl-beta-D-mannosaminyltransferase